MTGTNENPANLPWWLPPPLAVGASKVNEKGLRNCLAPERRTWAYSDRGGGGGGVGGEKSSVYRRPVAAGAKLTETDAYWGPPS